MKLTSFFQKLDQTLKRFKLFRKSVSQLDYFNCMMHWLACVQLKLLLISYKVAVINNLYKPMGDILANLFSFCVTPLVLTIAFIDFELASCTCMYLPTGSPDHQCTSSYHYLSDYVFCLPYRMSTVALLPYYLRCRDGALPIH